MTAIMLAAFWYPFTWLQIVACRLNFIDVYSKGHSETHGNHKDHSEQRNKTQDHKNPPSYRNSGRYTHFRSKGTTKLKTTQAQLQDIISMENLEADKKLIAHDGIHLTDGTCMIVSNTVARECLAATRKDRDVRYDDESIRIMVQDTSNRSPHPHPHPTPDETSKQ